MLLVAVLVFLVLLLWSPIAAFEQPLGAALFAAVFGAGALALARKTMLEETAAEPPVRWS
jgi:tellurite resistance protein TehA-like permease